MYNSEISDLHWCDLRGRWLLELISKRDNNPMLTSKYARMWLKIIQVASIPWHTRIRNKYVNVGTQPTIFRVKLRASWVDKLGRQRVCGAIYVASVHLSIPPLITSMNNINLLPLNVKAIIPVIQFIHSCANTHSAFMSGSVGLWLARAMAVN